MIAYNTSSGVESKTEGSTLAAEVTTSLSNDLPCLMSVPAHASWSELVSSLSLLNDGCSVL